MSIRELFHKRVPLLRHGAPGLIGALILLVGCTDAGNATAEAQSAAATASVAAGTAETRRSPMPLPGHAWVIFGPDTVVAEVAATPEERAEGLMYRDEVPDGTGMLFVFEDNQPRAFWMANTYVALDVAYLDPSYRIVDIIAMEPLVTDSYPSDASAMFALEVRQGWFEEHEIGEGAQAQIQFGVQGR